MIDQKQMREKIIRPSLNAIDMYSPHAEELLIGTMAQESLGGRYLVQIKGPALSPYMIEPATFYDVWKNIREKSIELKKKAKEEGKEISDTLHDKVMSICKLSSEPMAEDLIYNLYLSTIMCRLKYRSIKEPLPDPKSAMQMAQYWKLYYNTLQGKGTVDEFVRNYYAYVKA